MPPRLVVPMLASQHEEDQERHGPKATLHKLCTRSNPRNAHTSAPRTGGNEVSANNTARITGTPAAAGSSFGHVIGAGGEVSALRKLNANRVGRRKCPAYPTHGEVTPHSEGNSAPGAGAMVGQAMLRWQVAGTPACRRRP